MQNYLGIAMYEVSEAALLRDAIFMFQGIDGRYVKFAEDAGSYVIDNKVGPHITNVLAYLFLLFWVGEERGRGTKIDNALKRDGILYCIAYSSNGIVILVIQVAIPRSTRDLIHRLSELGWLYKRVQMFVRDRADDISIGLVGQVGFGLITIYYHSSYSIPTSLLL